MALIRLFFWAKVSSLNPYFTNPCRLQLSIKRRVQSTLRRSKESLLKMNKSTSKHRKGKQKSVSSIDLHKPSFLIITGI